MKHWWPSARPDGVTLKKYFYINNVGASSKGFLILRLSWQVMRESTSEVTVCRGQDLIYD
jgi:hypothetical protein